MEFLQEILMTIIAAAVPVVTVYLCRFLKGLYEDNKEKIKNENVREVLGQVAELVIGAVETTSNTYVKQLKADNLFDAEAQKEAFNKTKDIVMKQITEESSTIIEKAYGDVDAYVNMLIERFVKELKD